MKTKFSSARDSWVYHQRFFKTAKDHFPELEKILLVIDHFLETTGADLLFAHKSHHNLVISTHDKFWHQKGGKITAIPKGHGIDFHYVGTDGSTETTRADPDLILLEFDRLAALLLSAKHVGTNIV